MGTPVEPDVYMMMAVVAGLGAAPAPATVEVSRPRPRASTASSGWKVTSATGSGAVEGLWPGIITTWRAEEHRGNTCSCVL